MTAAFPLARVGASRVEEHGTRVPDLPLAADDSA
jgi:hypothetical protein